MTTLIAFALGAFAGLISGIIITAVLTAGVDDD